MVEITIVHLNTADQAVLGSVFSARPDSVFTPALLVNEIIYLINRVSINGPQGRVRCSPRSPLIDTLSYSLSYGRSSTKPTDLGSLHDLL